MSELVEIVARQLAAINSPALQIEDNLVVYRVEAAFVLRAIEGAGYKVVGRDMTWPMRKAVLDATSFTQAPTTDTIWQAAFNAAPTVEGEVKEFEDGIYTMSLYGGMIAEGEARYIHRFGTGSLTAPTTRVEVLPPPIDPDLVLARNVVAQRYVPSQARLIRDGEWDTNEFINIALAAIKASKAGGRV